MKKHVRFRVTMFCIFFHLHRKRTGGIKLDDNSSSARVKETTGETDNYNKQLAEDMKAVSLRFCF